MVNERPAKIGLLLIGSPRFKQLGEDTEHGTYGERKLIEEKEIIKNLEKMGEVVYTGITYEREDVDKARSVLRDSTVGLLACFNEAMWSTYLDPYNVFQKAGPELHFLSVAELCDEIEQVTDEELKKVTDEIKFDEIGDAVRNLAYSKTVDTVNGAFVFGKIQTIAD